MLSKHIMEIFALAILLISIVIILTLFHANHGRKTKHMPEPPGAWPIVGHLPMFTGRTLPYQVLAAISDKYGPVFALRLGTKKTVIVSGLEAIKECFTTNDNIVASRPKCSLGRIMGHDYALFGLAPYGPYWRKLRKVCVAELLSISKVERFEPLRTSEIQEFIKELHGYSQSIGENFAIVNMSQWFCHLIINIILLMVATKRYPYIEGGDEGRAVVGVVRDFQMAAGLTVVSDLVPIPILRELLDFQGNLKAMKRATSNLDSIVAGWIYEHLERRIGQEHKDVDFIDSLLSQVGRGELKFDQFPTQVIIISTIEAIFMGATDSTCAALAWTVSLLMNHPTVLQRVQEELDQVVGLERWAEESDITNLTYLQAIVKESLRLYPPAPLGAPHEATHDCTISGYPVRKGTQLFFNYWKLQRDPQVWPEPDEFKPERFVSGPLAGVDVRIGKVFEILPFGAGRRICPASETAMRILHLTLARLLQGFEMATPDLKPVDMTEGQGIIAPSASPLQLILMPRLPHMMYQ